MMTYVIGSIEYCIQSALILGHKPGEQEAWQPGFQRI